MTTRTPQVAFSSGELDPLLQQRQDFQRWQSGLSTCRGFVPLRQGAFTLSPGTIWRGTTRENRRAIRVPFIFSREDALSLELTDQAMRVWRYGQLIETSPGVPYELVTPFREADLDNIDFVQNGDQVYVVDGVRPMQIIRRFALDNWTIEDATFTKGPFQAQNLDQTKRLTVGASEGTGVALSTDFDFFEAGSVGSILLIKPTDYVSVGFWVGGFASFPGALYRNDGKIYRFLSGLNTGLVPPVHTSGTVFTDSGNGVLFEFVSTEQGIVRITSVTDARNALCDVIQTVPVPAVSQSTYRWSLGAWSELAGYPSRLAKYRQRLYAANTRENPRSLWASTIGDFFDFEPRDEADASFAYDIADDRSRNEIGWLMGAQRGIYIGGIGEVYRGFSAVSGEAIGPETFDTELVDAGGAAAVRPARPYGFPVFVSSDRRALHEARYSFETDAIGPKELSLPSRHLGAAGFKKFDWQTKPDQTGWLITDAGEGVAVIYDPEEDVLGWVPYPVAGGVIEDLDVTPSPDGSFDVVTFIVRRQIGGEEVRFVEEQAVNFAAQLGAVGPEFLNHAFAGRVFAADPETDWFDMSHLIGETVWAWTDKGQMGPYTVPLDGQVQLDDLVGHAIIGLADDTRRARTLALRASAPDGDARGRPMRVQSGTGIGIYQTAAGQVQAILCDEEQEQGGEVEELVRDGSLDQPGPVVTALLSRDLPTGHEQELKLEFTPRGIAPLTITAVVPPVDEAGA